MTKPIVVITGAAGGIGRATVTAFIKAGYGVVGVDVADSVRDVASEDFLGMKADHSDLHAVEDALRQAAELGPVQHIAAFAGSALAAEIELGRRLPHPDLFRASVERNLLGHVNVLWAAEQFLLGAPGDRSITLCSSVNALQAFGEPAYSTAKSGLFGLVRSLVVPYGQAGVRINAVAPGTTDTPTVRAEYADLPEHFTRMEQGIPLGRLGRAEDVATLVLALTRDLTHVTGQVIVNDGGQTVSR